jgi:acyl carrier protein
MLDTRIKNKVIEIVNKVSGGKTKKINPDGDLKNELSLDSIQLVELFATLEKEFNVELPLAMMTVKTGKEFLEMLENCLNKTIEYSKN